LVEVKSTFLEIFQINLYSLGFFEFLMEENVDEQKEEKEKNEAALIEVLKYFSPGTALRLALDDIQRAGLGALIVVDKEGLSKIIEGGIKINLKFTPQKLMELAKMDGAIILSEDMKNILFANALLVPNVDISTKETGTRHKAAERTAKQFGTVVVAISERRNKITIYYGGLKYTLEPSSEILSKAIDVLQILEKQVEIYNESLLNLNVLEMMDMVTQDDVSSVIQRAEIINKISILIKKHLVELGKEGTIVSFRLKELTKNIQQEKKLIIKDYLKNKTAKIESYFNNLDLDSLLESVNLYGVFFDKSSEDIIRPKGFRIISKINLPEENKEIILNNSDSLNKILYLSEEQLINLFNDEKKVIEFKEELKKIKEKISSGKII